MIDSNAAMKHEVWKGIKFLSKLDLTEYLKNRRDTMLRIVKNCWEKRGHWSEHSPPTLEMETGKL